MVPASKVSVLVVAIRTLSNAPERVTPPDATIEVVVPELKAPDAAQLLDPTRENKIDPLKAFVAFPCATTIPDVDPATLLSAPALR